MTTREKVFTALGAAVSPTLLGLAWWAIDRHMLDRSVRLLDRLRL